MTSSTLKSRSRPREEVSGGRGANSGGSDGAEGDSTHCGGSDEDGTSSTTIESPGLVRTGPTGKWRRGRRKAVRGEPHLWACRGSEPHKRDPSRRRLSCSQRRLAFRSGPSAPSSASPPSPKQRARVPLLGLGCPSPPNASAAPVDVAEATAAATSCVTLAPRPRPGAAPTGCRRVRAASTSAAASNPTSHPTKARSCGQEGRIRHEPQRLRTELRLDTTRERDEFHYLGEESDRDKSFWHHRQDGCEITRCSSGDRLSDNVERVLLCRGLLVLFLKQLTQQCDSSAARRRWRAPHHQLTPFHDRPAVRKHHTPATLDGRPHYRCARQEFVCELPTDGRNACARRWRDPTMCHAHSELPTR
eukprot:6691654-Prymnesium_polylepis.5